MYFASLADFIAMGGHGFYVWLAVGFSVFWLSYLVLAPMIKHKRLLREIAGQGRMDAGRRTPAGG